MAGKKKRRLVQETSSRRSADFAARILRGKGRKVIIRHKEGERYWRVME